MRRLLVCFVAVAMLPGCSGSGGSRLFDPFSRTTIEPPRTGWITGQPASDPYYSDTRQAALSSPGDQVSGWQAHSATTGAGTPPAYQPPGGYNFRGAAAEREAPAPAGPGDRIAIPVAARSDPDPSSKWAHGAGAESRPGATAEEAHETWGATAATSSAVATAVPASSASDLPPPPPTAHSATGELASRDRVVGTIQPGARGSAGPPYGRFSPPTVTGTEGEPRRLDGAPPAVDIMDLPPATSVGRSEPSTHSGGIRLVSGIEAADEPVTSPTQGSGDVPSEMRAVDAHASSPRARYAYDPEYRWLRGRLEYSETARRWKLRYVPVEGRTDQFGGSVVLSNPSELSGYERGQFVEVHGRLGPTAEDDDSGYAPEFEIAQIRRVGP